jgi:hypothetical protein
MAYSLDAFSGGCWVLTPQITNLQHSYWANRGA